MNIGFVGYSDESKYNAIVAKRIVEKIFKTIHDIGKDVNIVSGGTALGIPKLVFQESLKYGYPYIAFMSKLGYEYPLCRCDQIYAIGNNWGDESEAFINYIDMLIKIGGGKQSEYEFNLAKEKGIIVEEYEL